MMFRSHRQIIVLLVFLFTVTGMLHAQHHKKIGRMEIYPKYITMRANSERGVNFTAVVYRADGTAFTPANLNWNANRGRISNDGHYYPPGRQGTFTVTVSFRRWSATSQVKVERPHSPITRVEVRPTYVKLQIGETCQFTVTSYNDYNQSVSFTPVWSVTGGGTIDANGVFRAEYAGQYTVTAKDSYSRQFGSARVFVVDATTPPPSATLRIYPQHSQISVYQTAKFTASYGQRSANVTWSTSGGGFINQNGVFRAGGVAGNYYIYAQDAITGAQATASIEVMDSGTPVPPYPHPHPNPHPHPHPGKGSIVVSNWDVGGGNFFRAKAKISLQVFGRRAAMVKLYAVSHSGKYSELQAFSCKNGSKLYFDTKFHRFSTKRLEIRLYNRNNKVIAKAHRTL